MNIWLHIHQWTLQSLISNITQSHILENENVRVSFSLSFLMPVTSLPGASYLSWVWLTQLARKERKTPCRWKTTVGSSGYFTKPVPECYIAFKVRKDLV